MRDDASGRPVVPDTIVGEVVDSFLGAVDQEAPGLVEGLYLVGSVALSDFRRHESDIDFVAVTATRPDEPALDAQRRAHSALEARYPRPSFEGIYVMREDLARAPELSAPALSWHDGRIELDSFALDPVTWHTLACHGIPARGPAAADLDVWIDRDALASWTLGNLESYWRPWRVRYASSSQGAALDPWAAAWGVLGVTRLHYTLATGEITSKTGAGLYALETFGAEWHRVIEECLRIRAGVDGPSSYGSPSSRRRDALAYMGRVIDDARRSRAGVCAESDG